MDQITIGDLIGYILTLIIGIITGSLGTRYISSRKASVTQKNNKVKGDLIGGDKVVKK